MTGEKKDPNDYIKINKAKLDKFKENMDDIIQENEKYNKILDQSQKVSDEILLKRFNV